MSPAVLTDTSSLAERIRTMAASGEISLPPLPDVAHRILELLRDEDRSDRQSIADLVEGEPAIAATVLRMANSAAFGGLREVSDLDAAIARLGLRQVGSVVTALTHQKHFQGGGARDAELLRKLWDHAVASALAARRLTHDGSAQRADAYVAGLLHDIGNLVVLRALERLEREGAAGPVTAAVRQELMDTLHAQLGHDVLVGWHIPAPIAEVALRHHEPPKPQSSPLLLHVQAGDAIATLLVESAAVSADSLDDHPALERLNLSDIELATLLVDVEDDLSKLRELL